MRNLRSFRYREIHHRIILTLDVSAFTSRLTGSTNATHGGPRIRTHRRLRRTVTDAKSPRRS